MKYLGRIAFLTTIWVLMWGSLSTANVLSGTLVAALLLVAFPVRETPDGPSSMLRLRPVALARLLGWIGVQLIMSNAQLVREVLTRGSRIRTLGSFLRHRSSNGRMTVAAAGSSDQSGSLLTTATMVSVIDLSQLLIGHPSPRHFGTRVMLVKDPCDRLWGLMATSMVETLTLDDIDESRWNEAETLGKTSSGNPYVQQIWMQEESLLHGLAIDQVFTQINLGE